MKKYDLLIGVAGACLAVPQPSLAQDETGAQVPTASIGTASEGAPLDATSRDTVEMIVVTAQRREQNLQDTPVSVTAFSSDTLAESGVTNLQELASIAPALQVSSTAGVYLPFLRGVGNGNASVGNESSVATYIDDLYYTRLATAYLELGSMDRVEVLNGPQGTLFGRNSSGGAIQMFTKDPGVDPALEATLGYASYDRISGNLYASTPITDRLGVNISLGGYHQRDGWGNSITTGEDVNLGWAATARAKLVWEPSDYTRIKLVGFYARSRSDIGSVQDLYEGTFGIVPVSLTSLKNDKDSFYDTQLDRRPDSTEEGYGASLRIDQEASFADLVSITGFRNSKGNYGLDLDYSPLFFYHADLGNRDDQFSQEFQIKSRKGSSIDWILGFYYLHWKAGYDPAIGEGPIFGGGTLVFDNLQTVDSFSGFAQATAPIGRSTNVTLGVRYTLDDLSVEGTQFIAVPGLGNIPLAPDVRDSRSEGAFTYRAAIDHRFSDQLLIYASTSRGYKSGAYNLLPAVAPPAEAEKIQAYEVGFKSDLFDKRVRLNGALFQNDIRNPQVLTTVDTGVSLTNAQKARVRGAEVSVEAVPVSGLTLRGAATYLDAKYKQFDNAPIFTGGMTPGTGITGPVLGDGAGNRMANVPEWRLSAGVNYNLLTDIGEWTADVGVSYTSDYPWTADNNLVADDVTLVNASLSFTPSSSEWLTLRLWGRNLAGERYYLIGQESAGPGGTAGYPAAPAPPRTYGGTISVTF